MFPGGNRVIYVVYHIFCALYLGVLRGATEEAGTVSDSNPNRDGHGWEVASFKCGIIYVYDRKYTSTLCAPRARGGG